MARSDSALPAPAEEVLVVLLPGLDGTGQLLTPFVARHPEGFRPVPLDFPADRLANVDELIELALRRLPQGRWILLAESFSGPLAIRLAATQPPGLVGLVLVATAAKWSRLRWLREAPLTSLFGLAAPPSTLRWLLLGDEAPTELVVAAQRAISSVRPDVLASRVRELAAADVTEDLAKVKVPILYLQARQDRIARGAERRSIEGVHPLVDAQVLDGPHFLLQTAPDAVWQLLAAFAHGRCPMV
ncbi:MAG TPA: alpha/beta hydrolase [Thermoanaerobaculia bacterium]|jgi:pimeloyl-ACP methyl ester carboxylesterase|nr:alpha/beta hydrolase [Thermoanaerobaculia bacterium]